MSQSHIDNPLIGRRIALLRDELNLTQEELADKLGFVHRQTLQAVESGKRRLRVEELLGLIELSGRSLEYFTDPFHWAGEGSFSFRMEEGHEHEFAGFEQEAAQWAMLWRWLADCHNLDFSLRPDFGISARTSFEGVANVAETIRRWFQLGDRPAKRLASTIEEELRIPVLFADLPDGYSGAAYNAGDLQLIYVNRKEVPGRRNFDLAHEFFHILSWSNMPPPRIDVLQSDRDSGQRQEKLANVFASALLMPKDEIITSWKELTAQKGPSNVNNPDLIDDALVEIARQFEVTIPALLWRLVNLGMLPKNDVNSVNARIAGKQRSDERHAPIPLFSRYFLTHLSRALEDGRLSARRAASLLNMDIDGLATTLQTHKLDVPFDL
jgi:XRE family transcriptional regulator, fatty acid utilization regulator